MNKFKLPTPIELSRHYEISYRHTIQHLVSIELPPIVATFVLVQWFEIQCGKSVQEFLNKKYTTLGESISITHNKAVEIDSSVIIQSKAVAQNSWRIDFIIEAHYKDSKIAQATHSRNIVPLKLFDVLTPLSK